MTATLGRGVYLALCLLGTAAWGLLVYGYGSRWLSPGAGALLAFSLSMTVVAYLVGSTVQESRLSRLLHGVCPGCGAAIAVEHRHRRWEPESATWPSPSTSWQCESCGYSHAESWDCPSCPLRGE